MQHHTSKNLNVVVVYSRITAATRNVNKDLKEIIIETHFQIQSILRRVSGFYNSFSTIGFHFKASQKGLLVLLHGKIPPIFPPEFQIRKATFVDSLLADQKQNCWVEIMIMHLYGPQTLA